MSGNLKII